LLSSPGSIDPPPFSFFQNHFAPPPSRRLQTLVCLRPLHPLEVRRVYLFVLPQNPLPFSPRNHLLTGSTPPHVKYFASSTFFPLLPSSPLLPFFPSQQTPPTFPSRHPNSPARPVISSPPLLFTRSTPLFTRLFQECTPPLLQPFRCSPPPGDSPHSVNICTAVLLTILAKHAHHTSPLTRPFLGGCLKDQLSSGHHCPPDPARVPHVSFERRTLVCHPVCHVEASTPSAPDFSPKTRLITFKGLCPPTEIITSLYHVSFLPKQDAPPSPPGDFFHKSEDPFVPRKYPSSTPRLPRASFLIFFLLYVLLIIFC